MNDKLAHCIVGFALSIMGVLYFPMIFSGFFLGVGKALIDNMGHGKHDIMDALATFAGAGIATGIVLLIVDMQFLAWH